MCGAAVFRGANAVIDTVRAAFIVTQGPAIIVQKSGVYRTSAAH
jgi:hypothetical protein